jgi:lipoprotein LprG
VRTIVGWRRGVVAAVVAITLPAAFVACSSGGGDGPSPSVASLPPAAPLLNDAAEATRQVKSARFDLAGNGSIAGVEVDDAAGTVTSDGRAQGIVHIKQAGSLVEIELVVIGKDIYIKGPTGHFVKVDAEVAGAVFDPSQILSPDRGLAELLEFATEAKTVGEEEIGGVDTWKVEAQLDGTLVSHLMPLPAVNKVPGTLWISKDDGKLVQISVTAPQAGGKTAEITLHLSDFGVQTEITPPA